MPMPRGYRWPGKGTTGLNFVELSHPWGLGVPNWPYFEDVKIERLHYMAKSGVLSQRITTVMHSGTHMDAPAHVVEGTPFLHEIPLECFFGTGVVVSIPEEEMGSRHRRGPRERPPQDPEGRHRASSTPAGTTTTATTGRYYAYSPGFYKEAGEWFADKQVKMVGTDTQALDHPLGTAIGPHGPGAAQRPAART